MIHLGRGRIQDRGLQGIVLKRGAADGVFHRKFSDTIGGVTKHKIRRQDQPLTTNLNPTTTGDITQTGTGTGSLLGDGIPSPTTNDGTTDTNKGTTATVAPGLQGRSPETRVPSLALKGLDAGDVRLFMYGTGPETGIPPPTTNSGSTDSHGGVTSTAAPGLQGSGSETGNQIATRDGAVILTTNGSAITLTPVTEILTPTRSPNDRDFITELPVTVTVSGGIDLPGGSRVTIYTTTKSYAVYTAPPKTHVGYGSPTPTNGDSTASPTPNMHRNEPTNQASHTPRSERRLLFFGQLPSQLAPEGFYALILTVAQYLSTLLAVLLAILWRIIDTDFKRMEPFYELSSSRGLPRPGSLCKNYLFYNAAVVPLIAGYRGQLTVCISGMIVGPIFTVAQILASTVLIMTVERPNGCNAVTGVGNCGRTFLATRNVLARVLQGESPEKEPRRAPTHDVQGFLDSSLY